MKRTRNMMSHKDIIDATVKLSAMESDEQGVILRTPAQLSSELGIPQHKVVEILKQMGKECLQARRRVKHGGQRSKHWRLCAVARAVRHLYERLGEEVPYELIAVIEKRGLPTEPDSTEVDS